MSTPNVELLQRTLAHIEQHPQQWYQGWWMRRAFDAEGGICGTAYCFAGHATLLHGAKIAVWNDQDIADEEPYVFVRPLPDDADFLRGDCYDTEDGAFLGVATYARTVLGLDAEQTDRLFAPWNTLDDLRRIVAELCAEAEGA